MNRRQKKKKFKKIILLNLRKALKEVKLMRKGILPKKTWNELKEEIKQFKE